MSNIDFDFILKQEGFETEGYVPDAKNSKSGVTIASGFDLGARVLSDLKGLPEDIVKKSWNQVQSNIGKFQQFFGNKNFIIVDNNDAGDDVFGMVGTQVRKMLSRKVDNIIAKSWIARELRLKQR